MSLQAEVDSALAKADKINDNDQLKERTKAELGRVCELILDAVDVLKVDAQKLGMSSFLQGAAQSQNAAQLFGYPATK